MDLIFRPSLPRVKPVGLAGIQLDANGATGDFMLSLSPASPLTAARRWSFPDRTDTVAGLGAQTFTGAQTIGALTLITDTTEATSLTAAALVVNGGAAVAKTLRVGLGLIIGTDPGGSELLRVGGAIRCANSFTVTGPAPVPILNSTAASDPATFAYFSFQRNAVEKGWMGYGDGVSGLFKITNNIGDIRFLPSGQVIVGADPGGSELLRVGGTGRFSGKITTVSVVPASFADLAAVRTWLATQFT